MSSTPPPFGDPNAVDRENSKAIRKGVAFGCGGCALLVIAGIVFAVGIFAFVMSILRNTDVCTQTLKAAQASEVMKRELGEPLRLGWLVTGSISTTNGQGTADVTVPIAGPAGDASVHTVGTKESGGPWVYSRMEAKIEKTGQVVDLR